MVSERKKETAKEVKAQLKDYSVVGILDMHGLPAKQLHEIRKKMKESAKIRMVKKRVIGIILKDSGLKGADELTSELTGQPALLMSRENPFTLARMISESKTPSPAKEGDIAPRDIIVRAGPTSLPAGPVIGELQKAKIPAMIEGDKIAIRQDTTVAREGETITKPQADILTKLGVEPMEMGLNLIAALEEGIVYRKDILFIPPEHYINDLKSAAQMAFNLTCNISYYTPYNIQLFVSRAHSEAFSLAMEAGIVNSETVKMLLARGHAQAEALKSKAHVPAEPAEAPAEAEPEEKKDAAGEKPDAEEAEKKEAPAENSAEKPDAEEPAKKPAEDKPAEEEASREEKKDNVNQEVE